MNRLIYIFCGLVITTQVACKKSALTSYNAADNIYFSFIQGADAATNTRGLYSDSTDVTFSFSEETTVDTIIGIPLSVTGVPKDYDRTYGIKTDPSSTAVLNTDYEFSSSFTVRAGNIQDTLFLKLKRTPLLKTSPVSLILQLEETEDLKTQIKFRNKSPNGGQTNIASTDTVFIQKFKVTVADMLAAGPFWDRYSYYFGEFSEKKVRLMNSIAGMPLNFWSVSPTSQEHFSNMIYYGGFMFRYLSDQAFAGNTIFEDNGLEMTMGDYFR